MYCIIIAPERVGHAQAAGEGQRGQAEARDVGPRAII